MTRGELIQLLAGVLLGVAIWSIAAERRMVRRMRLFHATRPENALSLGARTPVARFRLWRMLRAGAVIESRPDAYYLDATAYERYRDARRKRAIMIMVMVLVALTVMRRAWL